MTCGRWAVDDGGGVANQSLRKADNENKRYLGSGGWSEHSYAAAADGPLQYMAWRAVRFELGHIALCWARATVDIVKHNLELMLKSADSCIYTVHIFE